MKHQDEIRSVFQDWFVDCGNYLDAAILYGKIYCELQRCLEEAFDEDGDTDE